MRGAYEELVNTRDASVASEDSSDDEDRADDAREARAAQIGGEAAVPLGFVDWVKRLVLGLGGIATTFLDEGGFITDVVYALPSPF